jgi:2-polyprenyl-6-methoxyphenol hydroxylase-like FAD-dependent oxidoreductase
MNSQLSTDVIIIGSGPTGLALACQFVRLGIDFIIVEQNQGITRFSKAIGVQARTLEIYEQFGIADTAVGKGTIAKRASIVEGGVIRASVELSKIGEGLSAYPFLLLLEQNEHEQILNEFLEKNGKSVLWQTTLDSFTQNSDGVSAQVTKQNGETQTINAKYLVGCDGAKSHVRHALGLSFEGSTFERTFYVADVNIDWTFNHNALHICLAKNTLTAFFPLPGQRRYRIVGTFPEEFSKEEGDVLYGEIEQQIIRDTKLELDITAVNWFSAYRVHSRRVNSFSEGRCFVAGDAAHIHSPAGAQGMNTGIQDGYNLAWKLAYVLRGAAGPKLLDTYNSERLANAKRLVETTDRMFELGGSDEWFISYLRTHLLPYFAGFILEFESVKHFIFQLVSQIGINYRNSPLSIQNQELKLKVKAGDRLPLFFMNDTNIYDRLREPSFHYLAFSNQPDSFQELASHITKKFAGTLDFVSIPMQPDIMELFGMEKPVSILLRPDNYIGEISSEISLGTAERYFSRFLQSHLSPPLG